MVLKVVVEIFKSRTIRFRDKVFET
jgi:hypothetical protein